MPVTVTPEFSRQMPLEELESGPVERRIEANPAEREALARRFDLLGIESLTARVTIRRLPAGPLIRVEGVAKASVTQQCVVTLQPIPATVEAPFSETFGPEGYEGRDDPEDEEVLESYGEEIDIGEVAAQNIALSLDPYPRAPGVELPGDESGTAASTESGRSHPFAILGDLLGKRH